MLVLLGELSIRTKRLLEHSESILVVLVLGDANEMMGQSRRNVLLDGIHRLSLLLEFLYVELALFLDFI